MNESLQVQINSYLLRLDGLIGRGSQLRDLLAADPFDLSTLSAARVWQEDCGATINQLSGGSKAHWLARSFSEAFLMRSAAGNAVETAAPAEIVDRLLEVLERAVTSLTQKDRPPIFSTAGEPAPRRFDFVHNSDLRPIVEQAYAESRRAFEQGDYDLAMRTSCGILEAIVTDALEHKGSAALAASAAVPGTIADWSFQTRLAVAEQTGLIRSGWVRLPDVARHYREHGTEAPRATVSQQDARRAGQVLHVVMRDLNPGR